MLEMESVGLRKLADNSTRTQHLLHLMVWELQCYIFALFEVVSMGVVLSERVHVIQQTQALYLYSVRIPSCKDSLVPAKR